MIPSFFTALATGTITTMVATIMALSSWITGSQIIQGNVFYDTTNNATPVIYRNTVEALSLTQSGVELKSNGLTVAKAWNTTCTNTGGLAKYPTCYVRSPYTTTGALAQVSLECGNTNVALTMSGGFVKSTTAAVATAFPTLNDLSAGTGSMNSFNARATSGSYVLWNPADAIKFQSVTAIPAGGINCAVHVEAYDKYGN